MNAVGRCELPTSSQRVAVAGGIAERGAPQGAALHLLAIRCSKFVSMSRSPMAAGNQP